MDPEFNQHLRPTDEEVLQKKLEDEKMSFMRFMGNMEKYQTLRNEYEKSKPKPKPAPVPQRKAPPPKPKPVKATPILKPKAEPHPYDDYFG